MEGRLAGGRGARRTRGIERRADARREMALRMEKREGYCVGEKRKASQMIRFSWVYRYSVKNTITKESLFLVFGHPVPDKTPRYSEPSTLHRTGKLHNS